MGAQYESIGSLEGIGAEWDELADALAPPRVRPRQDEELLSPRHILEAVRRIGPAASREFYRDLAGDRDAGARREAAVQLAHAPDEASRVVLRNLLSDPEVRVRVPASVSLLVLGEELAKEPITGWLRSADLFPRRDVLEQLLRVRQVKRLEFARKDIEVIATDDSARSETRRIARALSGRFR